VPEQRAVPAPFHAVVVGPLAKVLGAFAVAFGLVGSDWPGFAAGQYGKDGRGRRTCGPQRTYHATAGNRVDGERRVADRSRTD